jgi:hypothetical protein
MKRRITYSILLGFIFVLLSLFYKTGAKNLEPMPYLNGGCGQGGVCGVIAIPPRGLTDSNSLARRGLPLPVVSLRADEDSPSYYYKSLIVVNILIDFVVFAGISYGLLMLPALKKSRKSDYRN